MMVLGKITTAFLEGLSQRKMEGQCLPQERIMTFLKLEVNKGSKSRKPKLKTADRRNIYLFTCIYKKGYLVYLSQRIFQNLR